MRLDYALYVLAAVLLIISVVPFIVSIGLETTETRSVWVVASVVLGLLSFGFGYSQRPKTAAQKCAPTTMEAPKEETEAPKETPETTSAPTATAVTAPKLATGGLTQVKGIGEKRATQLKALGINSTDELAKASAKDIAKKLKISQKTVAKWIDAVKERRK